MTTQMQLGDQAISRCDSPTDCYRIFSEEMDSLYFLAYLLTADQEMAERCFGSGLEECVDRFSVLLGSARSWARTAIVKCSIGIIRPAPLEDAQFVDANRPAIVGVGSPFGTILSLPAFERFVFVMSILEGRADEDCVNLLSCSRQDFMTARKNSLKRFGAACQLDTNRFVC